MKKAILVVSFGSTHLDTLEKSVAATEQSIARAFPEIPVFRAFTSTIVRTRLKSLHGIEVDSVEQALSRMEAEGVTHVTIQPTLLIPGEEFDRLHDLIHTLSPSMEISMGRPLLCTEEDLDEMIALVRKNYPARPDTVLLMMGHGTGHQANECYIRMAEKMRTVPQCTMRLCTVEGTPTFEDALEELRKLPHRRVILAPMMLAAGDHAKNDMDGNESGSLRSLLEKAGFSVTSLIRGLGELPDVQSLYISRIRQAKPLC